MKMPSKTDLPIQAEAQSVLIDQKKIDQFHQSFKDTKSYLPPTLYAVGMKGVFDLINRFEVDWRNLLHASQSFEYLKDLQVPTELQSQTQLVDIKERASFFWLQFQTENKNSKTGETFVKSKTLIMVKA